METFLVKYPLAVISVHVCVRMCLCVCVCISSFKELVDLMPARRQEDLWQLDSSEALYGTGIVSGIAAILCVRLCVWRLPCVCMQFYSL